MWKDPSFDVTGAVQGIKKLSWGESIVAVPLSHLYPGCVCQKKKKKQLSIDHFDVIQGCLSDCWLLSVISTVAYSTDLIENIIIHNDDVQGFTIFSLLGKNVIVDHTVPVLFKRDGSHEIFAPKLSKEFETWPILLEKAIIKIMGSYLCPHEIKKFNYHRRIRAGQSLVGPNYIDVNGGFPRWTMGILFNLKFEPIHTKHLQEKEILRILCCTKNEVLVACACTSLEKSDSFVDQGFVYGHCYSILYVQQKNSLIRVRNPWGTVESTKYDDDGVLNGTKYINDGEFYVDVNDFKERFPLFVVLKIIKNKSRLPNQ